MQKILFLSDLDNTLIFSYKRMSDENICVETKEGKKLSYMTPEGAALFGEIIKQVTFIPVTTRSREQYERITFPCGIIPGYAVIDNGGSLLVNGVCDSLWQKDTDMIFSRSSKDILICREYLERCTDVYFEIRIVDGAFLFTKCHECERNIDNMRRTFSLSHTELFAVGDKLYAIPRGINKENALLKLRQRFPDSIIIAAGDSEFDAGMLSLSDIPVFAGGLSDDPDGSEPDHTLKCVYRILEDIL